MSITEVTWLRFEEISLLLQMFHNSLRHFNTFNVYLKRALGSKPDLLKSLQGVKNVTVQKYTAWLRLLGI